MSTGILVQVSCGIESAAAETTDTQFNLCNSYAEDKII